MWKSTARAHYTRLFAVQKNVENFLAFHRQRARFFLHNSLSTFPQQIVESQTLCSLELMLEVMSRTTMMVFLSVWRRFSTLRMELRTVAWLRPS